MGAGPPRRVGVYTKPTGTHRERLHREGGIGYQVFLVNQRSPCHILGFVQLRSGVRGIPSPPPHSALSENIKCWGHYKTIIIIVIIVTTRSLREPRVKGEQT